MITSIHGLTLLVANGLKKLPFSTIAGTPKTLGLQIVNSQRVLQGLQGLVAQQFVDVVKVGPAPDYVLCPDVIPMPCTV